MFVFKRLAHIGSLDSSVSPLGRTDVVTDLEREMADSYFAIWQREKFVLCSLQSTQGSCRRDEGKEGTHLKAVSAAFPTRTFRFEGLRCGELCRLPWKSKENFGTCACHSVAPGS